MNSRKTFASIDLEAYRYNLRYLTSKASPAKVMAVVKADGYGHGALQLARIAQDEGLGYLAVAFLEEGLKLREAGIKIPILVLNYVEPSSFEAAFENKLTLTIVSHEQLKATEASMKSRAAINSAFHIAVDTGMRRLGLEWRESVNLLKASLDLGLNVEGAYTHFATADDKSSDLVAEQMKAFLSFLSQAERITKKTLLKHISNSAGILYVDNSRFDYVRAGIASYGLQPSSQRDENLRPVLQWKTCVSFVKKIYPGYGVSYGQTFVADREMTVATIPVGYADGYNRHLSNRGCVIISGRRCPVLGRVCMDQFVVDVTHLDYSPNVGDEVVLIGNQGDENITAEEMAEWNGTINYEVTCAISSRVPRLYMKGENI